MVSRLIRWLFFRNSLGTYIHRIETLIKAQQYSGACHVAVNALKQFPNNTEILSLYNLAEQLFLEEL